MRRGSTKSLTFAINKGQQITKDRVTHVTNPRSSAQMRQRLTFSAAALFYKRAIQNLFKFAFETKKQTESDYNAFMRVNTPLAPCFTKNMIELGAPAIAPWIMTQGKLESAIIDILPGNENQCFLNLDYKSELSPLNAHIWGNLSKAIIASYPTLQDGDIITFVTAYSGGIEPTGLAEAKAIESFVVFGPEETGPRMAIHQARLDVNSTEASEAVLPIGEVIYSADDHYAELYEPALYDQDEEQYFPLYGMAVIFSRPTAEGVLVSSSQLTLNQRAKACYNIGTSEDWKAYASTNYVAPRVTSADNILQGSLLNEEVEQGIKSMNFRTPISLNSLITNKRIVLKNYATRQDVMDMLWLDMFNGSDDAEWYWQEGTAGNDLELFVSPTGQSDKKVAEVHIIGGTELYFVKEAGITGIGSFSVRGVYWGAPEPQEQGIKSTDIEFPAAAKDISGKQVVLVLPVASESELTEHLELTDNSGDIWTPDEKAGTYYLVHGSDSFNSVTVNGNIVKFGSYSGSGPTFVSIAWNE